MEQMSELDYQISVMQAFKEGRKIEVSDTNGEVWMDTIKPSWNWYDNTYRVKPEPPQPKTVPFSFEDEDFIVGLRVKGKNNDWSSMITHANTEKIWFGDGGSLYYNETGFLNYKCPKTEEWKPFVKVIQ